MAALFIAVLITAATDEGGVRWVIRTSRVLPLAPLCGALGTWVSLARARSKGETLALASLGRSPWQVARAAVVGSWLLSLAIGIAILASSQIDLSGFFPTVSHTSTIIFNNGAFIDPPGGWRIDEDGVISRIAKRETRFDGHLPPGARLAAALAVILTGLALPLIVGRMRATRFGFAMAIFGLASASAIMIFHAAAAGRVSPHAGLIVPALLFAWGVWMNAKDV